jgi:DNA-binding transcriptional LysR family regulator
MLVVWRVRALRSGCFWCETGAVPLVHVSDAPLRFDHADALIAAAIRGCGLVHLEDHMLARHFEAGRLVEMLRPFTADGDENDRVLFDSKDARTLSVGCLI